jgi:hypothetical protein
MKRILTLQSAASKILFKRVLAAFGLSALVLSGGILNAASPDFSTSIPRGGKAGSEVKVSIIGNRLSDAEAIVFHQPGMSFKDLKVVDDKKVDVTLVIAPDCRLGEHHFRVRCRSGISFARNFWVSQFPNHDEVEPNDDFAVPQKIPMNVTIEAEAKPEETDYYQISVKKGERISVEVEGLRINNIPQNIAIDPYVAILNKDRFEIASADGSALLKQESILSILAPEDGDYIVEVRDSAYQGRGRYRAHIGNYPRPTGIYPAGGKAGSEMEFSLLGDVKGSYATKVKLPSIAENDRFGVFAANGGLIPPSPNEVRQRIPVPSLWPSTASFRPRVTWTSSSSPRKRINPSSSGFLPTRWDPPWTRSLRSTTRRWVPLARVTMPMERRIAGSISRLRLMGATSCASTTCFPAVVRITSTVSRRFLLRLRSM